MSKGKELRSYSFGAKDERGHIHIYYYIGSEPEVEAISRLLLCLKDHESDEDYPLSKRTVNSILDSLDREYIAQGGLQKFLLKGIRESLE